MYKMILPRSRVRRAVETVRHPDQAVIASRLPVVGPRVPMQWFWRRRAVKRERVLRRGNEYARTTAIPLAQETSRRAAHAGLQATVTGAHAGVRAAHGGVRASSATAAGVGHAYEAAIPVVAYVRYAATPAMARAQQAAMPAMQSVRRVRIRGFRMLFMFATGALLMYFFDSHSGRRRRSLLRDKFTRVRNVTTHEVPHRMQKRRRFLRGVARGVQHNVAGIVQPHHVVPDDDTLVARVRSEVLRNGTAGQINVDAYEGCVTLRGQLEHYEDIQRIVHRTRHVDGVREIRSYLHLPGTLPPNKAEIYLKERVPAHLAGGDQGIGLAN